MSRPPSPWIVSLADAGCHSRQTALFTVGRMMRVALGYFHHLIPYPSPAVMMGHLVMKDNQSLSINESRDRAVKSTDAKSLGAHLNPSGYL